MNRAFLMFAFVLLAQGCHRPTPGERAASDAADVAAVEAAQNATPPAVPVVPEPVSFAVLDAPGSAVSLPPDVSRPGAADGCRFLAAGALPDQAAFVAVAKLGLIQQHGSPELLAADSGSALLADQLRAKYTSGEHEVTLTRGDPLVVAGNGSGGGWKGGLTVRDRYERVVYFSAGEMRCR